MTRTAVSISTKIPTTSAPPTPALEQPVQYLPGIGPKKAAELARLGILTTGDLLEHLPARHETLESRTIIHLDEGMSATIVGEVSAVRAIGGRRGGRVSATLQDNTGRCQLTWFSARYVADRLKPGMFVRATGKVRSYRDRPQLINPRIEVLGPDAAPVDERSPTRLIPIYPATTALPSHAIAQLIAKNLDTLLAYVAEWHPMRVFRERNWPSRREALRIIHRPRNACEVACARQRLAYDELLLMQLAVTLTRRRLSVAKGVSLVHSTEIDRRIRARFPFRLTRGQDRAVAEIVADLSSSRPMNRLLQGDVGCGKTVVALYAALLTIANRRQVAIMAPTELLSEQHYRSILEYLEGSRVRHVLLTGGLPLRQRKALLASMADGSIDLVVGTHALLQEDVQFKNLALVIVDEQHRFGVRQRSTLRGKGSSPHYLVMTATPIPRTLALTVFGDLDVTTIDELPPGRAPVTTRLFGLGTHEAAWRQVREELKAGRQAYVVYPIIDESDALEIKSVTGEFRRLTQSVLSGHSVGLIHGRLESSQRADMMRQFVQGRLSVLAATTVIEVGIDVPNATCMVIEHAERYGLSQLHQLRGRVGRGLLRGFCFLLTEERRPTERLSVLEQTTDGFRIAEEDLRLRGPGALLGARQHGLPELRVADLIEDGQLLRQAQHDASHIVRTDPTLCRAEHAVLRSALLARYRASRDFIGVG